MPIYTKKGDKGTTSIFNGRTLSKSDLRVMVIGTLDELNASLGMIRAALRKQLPRNDETNDLLCQIQQLLFEVGSELAGAENHLSENNTKVLEQIIDTYEEKLPPLNDFILPTGSIAASLCHNARSTCRRFERMLVILNQREGINPYLLTFFNRLSDLLFVLSRKVNQDEGYEDEPRRKPIENPLFN